MEEQTTTFHNSLSEVQTASGILLADYETFGVDDNLLEERWDGKTTGLGLDSRLEEDTNQVGRHSGTPVLLVEVGTVEHSSYHSVDNHTVHCPFHSVTSSSWIPLEAIVDSRVVRRQELRVHLADVHDE